jgi:hypothetical protein
MLLILYKYSIVMSSFLSEGQINRGRQAGVVPGTGKARTSDVIPVANILLK